MICPDCKKREKQKHHNSKWCSSCAVDRRDKPRSTCTAAQIREAKKLIGKMPAEDIAKEIGTSVSSLKRAFRGKSIWYKNSKYVNQPELVRRVVTCYEKHGRAETAKAFPGVNVRSIVERSSHYGIKMKQRQRRWTETEIILAAKMAGIVDGSTQATIFNRPGANEGSIKSLWAKRFRTAGGNIHGMSEWMAKEILKPGYPVLKTRVWSRRKGARNRSGLVRGLVLWSEMEPYLKKGVPKFIKDAVRVMAAFQRWLFDTDKPEIQIREMAESLVTND